MKTLSTKNVNYISKHRYYELKHYCLQYPEWLKELYILENKTPEYRSSNPNWSDSTGNRACRIACLNSKIRSIRESADELGVYAPFIFKAVTEDYGFNYVKLVMGVPCERDTWYKQYRKFFYILSEHLFAEKS